MPMKPLILLLSLAIIPAPIHAAPPVKVEDDHGVLNPDDTGRAMLARKIEMGVIDSVTCSLGVNATKYDNQALAKKLAKACAEAGYTKAMTWMSQMEDNGIGGDYDPYLAAQWDRRAADAGDPVGKFNYGLNLMRGHGVMMDETLGREYIDQAADDGLAIAKRLQRVDYDLDEVTPDADNWKYAPMY
jgi:hypothetical protein